MGDTPTESSTDERTQDSRLITIIILDDRTNHKQVIATEDRVVYLEKGEIVSQFYLGYDGTNVRSAEKIGQYISSILQSYDVLDITIKSKSEEVPNLPVP